jgi:hypothetical protein
MLSDVCATLAACGGRRGDVANLLLIAKQGMQAKDSMCQRVGICFSSAAIAIQATL